MDHEIIIKVDNKFIYLCPDLAVPIDQTNFPIKHCMFSTNREIFWKVALIEFNPGNECWKLKVIDYRTTDYKDFENQKSTRETKRIAFEKFDWTKLEPLLMNYQQIKLLDVLDNQDVDKFYREIAKQKSVVGVAETNVSSFDPIQLDTFVRTYKVEFSFYFSEAVIKQGCVTFSKKVKEVNEIVEFKIKNDYLLSEFESIKSWFPKILKTKKFKVYAVITTGDGKVSGVEATSPHVAMIDAALIESVKYQRTLALTKAPIGLQVDKSLFTAEEIFAALEADNIEGNVFKQSEQDIVGLLLDHHKTRNRMQLEFLAGNKQSEKTKLRFTLHPNFGFLFFIEGKEKNHFVWELLNSHATYIWSFDKSEMGINLQYKRIEGTVNAIRVSGRERYKRADRQNLQDNDLVFCVIEHNDINSDLVEGFVKWKHNLNEKIA